MNFSQRQIILLIICLLNLVILAFFLVFSIMKGNLLKFLVFFTIQNFIWSTAYLCFVTFCEIFDMINWSVYLFTIRRIGKYLFSTSWTVVFTYWIFTLMGNDVIKWNNELSKIISTIYLHFFIGLFMIYELVTNKERHYVKGVFYKDLAVLLIIFVIYSSLLIIIAKYGQMYAYEFLRKELKNCFGYTLSTLMNFICSYLLYYYFGRRFNKGIINPDEIESIETSNDEMGTIKEELV